MDIFKQAIDQPSAEALVTAAGYKTPVSVTADGAWLLYTFQKDRFSPMKMMRVPMSGGSPEFLLDAGSNVHSMSCAIDSPSTLCVVA